jgi:WD40 repeat protein
MKGDVEVIDVETGKRHKRMDITDGSVRAMALSANGKYVAAGGHNQRISVYDLQKGKPTYKQVGHSRRVTNIAFSPDSSRLVSASYDKTVRVWDLETSRTRHVLRGHSSYAYNVDWSDDGKRVASVQLSGSTVAILWDPETGKKVRQIDNVPSHAMDLVFRNDGKEVVIAGRKGGVKAYDTESGKSVYRVSVDTDGRRSYFYTVALSPNGRMFAAFGRQYLKLMDLDTKTAYTLPTNERIMYGHQNASFSPDGYLMAWSGVGQTHVIETISGREVMGFDRGKGRRNAVTFSADGRYLAVSHKSDNIDVYDLARGKRVARYGGHGDGGSGRRNYSRYGTSCLRFSPNGNMLASGGGKGTVLIWDFASAVSDQRDTEDSIDLEACWDDLANHDARRAYTAFWKLSRHGEEAAAFLADAMQPVAKPEQERIQRNIDSLDAEGYQARKQAYAELARFGPVVKREIRKALKGDLSLAGRRRLQELLRVMDSPTSRSPAVLRQLRAVRILRNVGGEQARKVLVSLTRGVKEAPQTQAARRALKLLRRTEGE